MSGFCICVQAFRKSVASSSSSVGPSVLRQTCSTKRSIAFCGNFNPPFLETAAKISPSLKHSATYGCHWRASGRSISTRQLFCNVWRNPGPGVGLANITVENACLPHEQVCNGILHTAWASFLILLERGEELRPNTRLDAYLTDHTLGVQFFPFPTVLWYLDQREGRPLFRA